MSILNKNDIKKNLEKIIYNSKQIINKNGELSETKTDIANIKYKLDNNNSIKTLKSIYKKIATEKKLLILIKKA